MNYVFDEAVTDSTYVGEWISSPATPTVHEGVTFVRTSDDRKVVFDPNPIHAQAVGRLIDKGTPTRRLSDFMSSVWRNASGVWEFETNRTRYRIKQGVRPGRFLFMALRCVRARPKRGRRIPTGWVN